METQGAQLAAVSLAFVSYRDYHLCQGKVTDLSQMATATKEIGQYKEVTRIMSHSSIFHQILIFFWFLIIRLLESWDRYY